jgi:serine/threonine protein kinase
MLRWNKRASLPNVPLLVWPTMQPTQLGPYSIDRQIGKGGMGAVYEATDIQTGQKVAIKALNPHLAQAEGFRERFEAEITSLKTLSHDGIVRLYGFGEQNGVLFYSMELVHGSSLEDELRAGRRFDWREMSDIAIQLCSALKLAHDHGIIHRDIKPANILFADDHQVKLADFGIARLFGNNNSLTTAGGVLGTADYMSPEQADGRPITARCDQYSLGGVMYALLAGRPPFRAKTLPEMLQLQRFAQPEPVTRYAANTPKQLESVIAQLLAKEPADRFPNMAVLARHLQAMVMALSRPAHDSFNLAGEAKKLRSVPDDLHSSLALAVTQAEPETNRPATPPPMIKGRESQASSASPAPSLSGAASSGNVGETMLADDHTGGRPRVGTRTSSQGGTATATVDAPRPSVFTTVEEELARQKLQQSRSWTAVVAPLATLVIAIATLGAFFLYLSRPATSEELYSKISKRVDADDAESMRLVEREIMEFLDRFPEDERSTELREYQQRLELERLHRQLQRHRGGVADPKLLPVETLYLDAMSSAATAPDTAIAKLRSLVKLYGTNPKSTDSSDRTALCVQLAERQLKQLEDDYAKLTKRQLAAIEERLNVAKQAASTDTETARNIYSAIVELYGHQPWAASAVATAQHQLEQLPKAND